MSTMDSVVVKEPNTRPYAISMQEAISRFDLDEVDIETILSGEIVWSDQIALYLRDSDYP